MSDEPGLAGSRRIASLAEKFHNKQYRDAYVGAHTRGVLARQMRNFRGDLSQVEYAIKIDKQKTVVGRLESPAYAGWSLRTMLEIARKENVAVIARFVDFPTFLSFTEDTSDDALHPQSYNEAELDRFAEYQEASVTYYDIPIPAINKDASIGLEFPYSTYQNIFFGASNAQQISISGSAWPAWPSNYFMAGSASIPLMAAKVLPPSPSALRRTHAEIRRLTNLAQAQAGSIAEQKHQIAELQKQLSSAGSQAIETLFGKMLRPAENPIQSQTETNLPLAA
jgi:hypothetical protein